MEERIQYARTKDGVSIAYSTAGEGLAVVQAPPIPFSQVQLGQAIPEDSQWWALSGSRRVRYDARGTGLSDRDVTDFSLDTMVSDLEAVVDDLGLQRFALWGFITSGPIVIAYAARYPERVSHLILWSAWARTSDVLQESQAKGLLALAQTDWELFTETAAHAFFGWSIGDLAHRAAVFMREGITPEATVAMIAALTDSDVTALLPEVRAPTVVFHSKEAPLPDISVARELASGIPNARFVVLEGTAAGSFPEEADSALRQFLGFGLRHPPEPARAAGGLATILFTDIVSSTEMTQRLGDAKAQELLRAHNAIVRDALAARGGTEIKHTGDGIMASFPTASGALECALAIQRGVATRGDASLAVHVGVNAGEPVAEESDLFGTAVQLASRRGCMRCARGSRSAASRALPS